MNRERVTQRFGLALLAAAFVASAVLVLRREARAPGGPGAGKIVLRFSHWQLEPGVRQAFADVARRYMALHPNVVVEQDPVPDTTYQSWARTQLVGGTAPDLMEIGFSGWNDELCARYFLPLGDAIDAPNPYNRGTSLAGVPWRHTFIDDMGVFSYSYSKTLLDCYSVSITTGTHRVFYNERLWRRILGDTPPPRTFAELMAVCRRVDAWSRGRARPVYPFVGSDLNAPLLFNDLFASQTQRLSMALSPLHRGQADGTSTMLGFLDGAWSFHSTALIRAAEIVREISHEMPPGFMELQRDEGNFYFIQQRALMNFTGNFEMGGIRESAPFPFGIFTLPWPSPQDPHYGPQLLGPYSESATPAFLPFAITRQTKHFAVALDFLRFLSSQASVQAFVNLSRWFPAVRGVTPPPEEIPFAPRLEGYAYGFDMQYGSVMPGTDSNRLTKINLNLLFGPDGSVSRFADTLQRELPAAFVNDLRLTQRAARINIVRQDTVLAACAFLPEHDPAHAAAWRKKLAIIVDGQTSQEAENAWISHELARLGHTRAAGP